jgi:tripartite-type tricarboxylate transporter receptor subunit TctC
MLRILTAALVAVALIGTLTSASAQQYPNRPIMLGSSALPNVATLAEQGLAGFDISLRYGLAAPAGTPPDIIDRLNKALNAALADDTVINRIRHEGAEPAPMTPQQYAADIDREETRWSAVVKELGIAGN